MQALARGGMIETERHGMQGHALRSAGVGERLAMERAVVKMIATERRTGLAQMDAHLVCAPRFQPALDQGEIAESFDQDHVRHGPLTLRSLAGAAPPAVAPVADKIGLDTAGLSLPADQRDVKSLGLVGAELPAQVAFGLGGSGEDYQTARLLVQAVDRSHPSRTGPCVARDEPRQEIRQCLGQEARARGPCSATSSRWRTVVNPAGLSTTTMCSSICRIVGAATPAGRTRGREVGRAGPAGFNGARCSRVASRISSR